MKSVLIAGGAGFIGSHLCDWFLANDHKVVCVDNLATGRISNISHLLQHEHFGFFQHDICEVFPDEVSSRRYDVVLHMASPASPPQYQRLMIETLQAGSIGTQRLLEVARINQARFLLASTSEVYGDPDVHPQTESYYGNVNSYGPRSMYDESKRYAEALVYAYRQTYALNTVIVRIFNTYGPRMDVNDGRVVSNFIRQALMRQPLYVQGDGSQTRSFCYIDDLIRGITALIPTELHDPINLGNPNEQNVLTLAEQIRHMIPTDSTIAFRPLPGDDPMQRCPDISHARALLQWEPLVTLEQGLRHTIRSISQDLAKAGSIKKSTDSLKAVTTSVV